MNILSLSLIKCLTIFINIYLILTQDWNIEGTWQIKNYTIQNNYPCCTNISEVLITQAKKFGYNLTFSSTSNCESSYVLITSFNGLQANSISFDEAGDIVYLPQIYYFPQNSTISYSGLNCTFTLQNSLNVPTNPIVNIGSITGQSLKLDWIYNNTPGLDCCIPQNDKILFNFQSNTTCLFNWISNCSNMGIIWFNTNIQGGAFIYNQDALDISGTFFNNTTLALFYGGCSQYYSLDGYNKLTITMRWIIIGLLNYFEIF